MGRRIKNPENKIIQKSVGFERRQIDFMDTNLDFKTDVYCRKIIDEQIKASGQLEFLGVKNE